MENQLHLDQQVCFPLYALSREVTNLYRPILEELDITYPQYLVMLVLWEEQTQTVNQLGQKLRLDSGTLTPLLKRLEQKGILSRLRNAKDERQVIISLTEAGNAMKEKALSIPKQLMEALGSSEEELLQLYAIITHILKNRIVNH